MCKVALPWFCPRHQETVLLPLPGTPGLPWAEVQTLACRPEPCQSISSRRAPGAGESPANLAKHTPAHCLETCEWEVLGQPDSEGPQPREPRQRVSF